MPITCVMPAPAGVILPCATRTPPGHERVLLAGHDRCIPGLCRRAAEVDRVVRAVPFTGIEGPPGGGRRPGRCRTPPAPGGLVSVTTTWREDWRRGRMKAIVQDRFGPPEVLRLADTGVPEVGAGDVLVRVRAAALNPADWHIVRGDPLIARLMGIGLTRPPQSPSRRRRPCAGSATSAT